MINLNSILFLTQTIIISAFIVFYVYYFLIPKIIGGSRKNEG